MNNLSKKAILYDTIDSSEDYQGEARLYKILDIGCGPSKHTIEFGREEHLVSCIDQSIHILHLARKRFDDEGRHLINQGRIFFVQR